MGARKRIALHCDDCGWSGQREAHSPGICPNGHIARIANWKASFETRFWQRVARGEGCWLWTSTRDKANGYGVMGRSNKTVGAHRLSWELTFGPIPPGLFVCHHCDNRPCVRPDHLFLGTHEDNQRDKILKGRTPRGEDGSSAKLTEAAVLAILGSTDSTAKLARAHNVSWSNIKFIRDRVTWKHLGGPPL